MKCRPQNEIAPWLQHELNIKTQTCLLECKEKPDQMHCPTERTQAQYLTIDFYLEF